MIQTHFSLVIDRILRWLREQYQKGKNPLVAVVPLEPIEKGTCFLCQKRHVNLCYQVQFLDCGMRIDACCLTYGGRILDVIQEFEAKRIWNEWNV